MYPVTQDFKDKIKENNRIFEAKIQIQHSKGVLNLTDKDLVLGTLIYTESSQAGEEFTVGSTVASDIKFTILNKEEYKDIQFMGATVTCNIGLLVREGIDAHFLQPSQPSKMKGFEEKWEYVPLGRFNIDDVNIQRNTIELKAIDNMIKFDLPYSLSKLSYPATLYQIYINACNVCDVLPGTVNFPNMHYSVKERPQDDLNFRDIIGYIAELSGTFAKCNRNGALELLWYTPTGLTLDPSNRFDFKPSDDVVQIKGIMATVEDTTYLAGNEDYAIDLTENPLLQGNYETVLPNIFNNVKDTVFTPYTSNWQGNPAIQAGDMLTQIDRDGKVYNTLVTKSTFKYRGKSNLEARGLPEIARGYKGDVHKKIAQIKKKIDVEIGDKLTDLEQAMLEATELITGQLGGYVLKRENELLIMDNPDPNVAQKIWRWNLSGLGYSNSGINGPYGLAMTMNGAINANFITTGLLSANLVQTGILQSKNGALSLNLDNGTWIFNNNIIQFTQNGLRVSHGSSNQYSEINYDGFKRRWEYGEGVYLNDIYSVQHISSGVLDTDWSYIDIDIPVRFRNRNIMAFVITESANFRPLSYTGENLEELELVAEVVDERTNISQPYIRIKAYAKTRHQSGSSSYTYYRDITFGLIVIGY